MEHVLPHFQEYSGKRQRLSTSSNSKEDIKATNNTSSETSLKVPDLHSTSQQTQSTKVRAQYQYQRVEHDELSFDAGDVIELVEDADDLGWCKGKIGETEGYFPANYCGPLH